MPAKLMNPDEILRLLASAPQRILAASAAHEDEWLAERSLPAEWSPNEILAHLRACQDIWGDVRVTRMLDEDAPTMRAVNPNTWLRETNYQALLFSQSLDAFIDQRDRFLRRLSDLSAEQWTRGGTFTGGGKPRFCTVQTEADSLARHERSHVKQIEKLCLAGKLDY